jgi:two-component system, OmpR family, sensor histidine kinase KdpD
MTEEGRPDPDALLAALTAEEKRGRLKVFLGAAPGVGKTFEMLGQATRRRAEGTDVVAGLIETHGRSETAAQAGDLPILPRRSLNYRGQTLEEFDLDAALSRRPGLLLVDELAHTNAPGSRHAKRWEDVKELLDAGIPVWTTVNVQHLESLNDDVARITGVRPSETLPDRVLEMAHEIELVDLPPAELRNRMKEGRIYRPDTARRALDGFFREGNLSALREMALRCAAARVDNDVRDWMRRSGIAGPWPAGERVLALVGKDAAAESVVRQAKRLADALHAPWVALHIERTDSTDLMATRHSMALASQLGAEVDVRVADRVDIVGLLLEQARERNATHLVIGRASPPLWRRLTGRRLSTVLLLRAPDFVVHVVPQPAAMAARRPTGPAAKRLWLPLVATTAAMAAVTAGGVAFRGVLPADPADMVYLAAVVACAGAFGTAAALYAATLGLLCWDFFFVAPLYTVTIDSPRDVVTAMVFAAVALLTGSLAGRVRAETKAAGARIEGLRRISAFSRSLGMPTTEPDLMAEIAQQAARLGGRAVVLSGEGEGLQLRASAPEAGLDDGAWAAARRAWTHAEPTGRGTATLPSVQWRFLLLRTVRGKLGVLGVWPEKELSEPVLQAIEALADQAAVALERVRLAAQSARAEALQDTQLLRTALLASLSHDLRTPLTGIQGAAGTLRGAWEELSPEVRQDLLASIEQDVGRMARFLANIADLTRLESGEVRPRLGSVAIAEVLEAAVARLADAPLVATGNADLALQMRADPALLEQALVNVLENAVKYAPAGSLVRVSTLRDGADVVLAVADEGVGIAPDAMPHVFDSFYRVHRGDRVLPGTGLGLAIARGLVEAMGGTIAAQSPNPDAPRGGLPGTVVTMRLPAA